MSDDDYRCPELEKTLIEIEDQEDDQEEEDILPIIIDVEEKKEDINIDRSIENIYNKIRERLISVIRSKVL